LLLLCSKLCKQEMSVLVLRLLNYAEDATPTVS
jgi:hypothetical protein